MRFHVVERAEPLFEFGARLGRLTLARAESIAPRTVDDDRDDVLQRPAVLALQRRVEQAEQQQRRHNVRPTTTNANAASPASNGSGHAGEKAIDQEFNARAFPAGPWRGPGRLCNCP